MKFSIESIAEIQSPYMTKFGVPRQSGMVTSDNTRIVFSRNIKIDAFDGLKVGNFIWVIFIFDQCNGVEKYQVRPPRLGGNKKLGVFATRSPFRPNNIGMSLAEIIQIEDGKEVVITTQGLDLANKTPIIDIKPYHPRADLAWKESEYWFGEGWYEDVDVRVECEHGLDANKLTFIKDVLAKDPRPAYHDDENRVYNIELLDYSIDFKIKESGVLIISIK